VSWVYDRLTFAGGHGAHNIREAWHRPVRPNPRIERAALWCALILRRECNEVLDFRSAASLIPADQGARVQYDFQAAIRSLPALLPFSDAECRALGGDGEELLHDDYEFRAGDVATDHAAEIAVWHEWLWAGSYDRQNQVMTSGCSAAYVESCDRLIQTIGEIDPRT